MDVLALHDACQEIGGVCGCNSGYQMMLAGRLLDRSLDELSVAELLAVIRESTADYNRIYAGGNG